MSSSNDEKPQAPKILGAVAAIVALAALLFWGAGQSQTQEAQLITDGEKPSQAAYESDARILEYEAARLGDYEPGTKIIFDAKVVSVMDEPTLGSQTAVVNIRQERAAGAETVKQEQVLLVFTDARELQENRNVHVEGRYIGAGEYETPVGSLKEIPAFQVDYLDRS